MKNFSDFLTESTKTYKFIVRVAGELPEGFKDSLERSLDKFKPSTLKSQLNATEGLTYRQSFGHLVEPLAMIVLLGLLLLRVRRGY